MGIFKAVGGALNQLSEFLTTAERNKQIKEGVANGELMEVHQASFIIQVKEMLIGVVSENGQQSTLTAGVSG